MAQLFVQSAWLIPCYPLLGMILSTVWFPSITRLTGPRPAGYVNLVMTALAFFHALLAFPGVWQQAPMYSQVTWLQVAGLDLSLSLEVSALTLGAILLVTGINFLSQLYAVGYLEMDWGWARFFALLALFEGGMCALALCDSLFFAYMILEILTLGTYLLIGLWFNQSMVVTGARDAFLTKRVGDLFLLMGVLAIFPLAGTWNFSELAVWAQTAEVDPKAMTLVGLALIAGPMGKCAQFPLHLWLDEAMEGAFPSTVLRNSVVVAVGAWVLVKLQPVLALSHTVTIATITIGALTAVGASLIAIAQIDVKRVLSYLASAYMGIVFMAVGSGQTEAALLLLLTYAVAISAVIMSCGSIVLNSITQNLTQLGGLWSRRPVSGLAYLAGAAGVVALPPFGGFWAMLELIDGLWATHTGLAVIVLVVNDLIAFGLARLFCLMFGNQAQPMAQRSPENLWPVTLPMVVMGAMALHLPLVLQSLDLLPSWALLDKNAALLLIWSSLSGLVLGAIVYLGPIAKPIQLPSQALQNLFAYDFYTPRLYRSSVVGSVDVISRIIDWGDRYIVDGLVNFVGVSSLFGGETLKYGNSGRTQSYVLTIAIGLTLIIVTIAWSLLINLNVL
ncbi:NAD(P)H-quinone oxidoreductase subunit F [filamentous cyanobacterium CCP5]|nr:NAD(P)H-quinone oxidoreductase subunit F [filamentous cyanobacterium CCP5]